MQKTKKILFILAIILISGLSGIFANRYIFPRLALTKFFSRYDFLKKSTSDVTIINKTEQVYIKDDTSINKIVNQVLSSVVNIASYSISEKKSSLWKNGAGLIVTSDGLIVTHVSAILAENATYRVLLDNGNDYEAMLLEIDSYSGLAFLKINANNFPAASFADSDEAKPGEKIIAIGNNSQFYATSFASGVLSSFRPSYNLSEKTVSSSEKLEGVFEVDISAQNKYVGGPIVDYSGQIIGITGVVSRDNKESFFQIPSNKVKQVIDKAIKKEFGMNPALGVYYVSISKTFANANKLPSESGALIYSPSGQQGLAVIVNSPAFSAGLRIGDIITAVATEKIEERKTLPDLLYKYKKGTEIELTILRNSQEQKIKVQL